MKSDCRCCRLVAYIGGVSELAIQRGWPRHRRSSGAIRPISWIRTMRRVREMIDRDHGRAGRRRPRRQAWIRLVRESVEYARSFAGHLMDVEPGQREAHVRAQIHTAEMIAVARFLEWEDDRVRDWHDHVSDQTACEVLEKLVGQDDFPVRIARVLGQQPPEPKPYLPASWIRSVLETGSRRESRRTAGRAG